MCEFLSFLSLSDTDTLLFYVLLAVGKADHKTVSLTVYRISKYQGVVAVNFDDIDKTLFTLKLTKDYSKLLGPHDAVLHHIAETVLGLTFHIF